MKIHKKYNHDLPGVGYWGDRGEVNLRVNFGKFKPDSNFPHDLPHYHTTRTTYFCVMEGELHVEVSGESLIVTEEQMLEIEPNEVYRTISIGSEGCSFVVIGSHNEKDKVVVEDN